MATGGQIRWELPRGALARAWDRLVSLTGCPWRLGRPGKLSRGSRMRGIAWTLSWELGIPPLSVQRHLWAIPGCCAKGNLN